MVFKCSEVRPRLFLLRVYEEDQYVKQMDKPLLRLKETKQPSVLNIEEPLKGCQRFENPHFPCVTARERGVGKDSREAQADSGFTEESHAGGDAFKMHVMPIEK